MVWEGAQRGRGSAGGALWDWTSSPSPSPAFASAQLSLLAARQGPSWLFLWVHRLLPSSPAAPFPSSFVQPVLRGGET